MFRRLCTGMALSLLSVMLLAGSALAAYPERPITFIVPFGAGGGTDIPARLLAGMMERKLGQPIVIQNVVGAGGTLGVSQAASAKPDGYTFGYVPVGTMCLQPHMNKLPYSKDSFDFIGMAVRQPVVLMSSKLAPWKNIQEFVEVTKKNPNKYIVAITSTGNMTHTPVLALAKALKLELRYIPFRSSPDVMKEMLAGRVQLHADAPAALSQFDVYGLLQFGNERAPNLDMPTTKEIGLDLPFSHWMGLVAPKGLDETAFKKISQVMEEVVTSPEFQAEAQKLKTSAYWMPSDAFEKLYEKEYEEYGTILRDVLAK